jgi:DhnA family fructose-bisphosphate aldolase class Ia
MPKSVARDFLSWIMLRDPATEPDIINDQTSQGAFGPEWVKTEIGRLTKGQKRPVVAGLGIGVPGGEEAETPELITQCTEACFQAGGKGILFSREYTEMAPELVKAAGDVVRREMAS